MLTTLIVFACSVNSPDTCDYFYYDLEPRAVCVSFVPKILIRPDYRIVSWECE